MISAVSLYSAGTGGILQTEERPYEIRLRGLGQKEESCRAPGEYIRDTEV